MRKLTPAVKWLLILNVAVFVLINYVYPDPLLRELLVLFYPSDPQFKPWQIISHAFMHAGTMHLVFNMIGLYFFGPVLETRLGQRNFLLLYFAALFGAVAAHFGSVWFDSFRLEQALQAFAANPNLESFDAYFELLDVREYTYTSTRESAAKIYGELQNDLAFGDRPAQTIQEALILMESLIAGTVATPMLGASGAVSGVVAAFAIFYPNQKITLLFPPIPVKAWILVSIIFGADLVLGVLDLTGDNIAHFAHVGGAVAGALLAWYFSKVTTPPWMKRIN